MLTVVDRPETGAPPASLAVTVRTAGPAAGIDIPGVERLREIRDDVAYAGVPTVSRTAGTDHAAPWRMVRLAIVLPESAAGAATFGSECVIGSSSSRGRRFLTATPTVRGHEEDGKAHVSYPSVGETVSVPSQVDG